MAGGRVYHDNSSTAGVCKNLSVLLQNQRVASSSEPFDPLVIPGSSPSSFESFLGTRSMVSFEDLNGTNRANRSFFRTFDQEENGGYEDLNEYFHQPEKKRRLTVDQVHFLEKSFEVENKLEPERKTQLAKDLGLQPRQVAIWFQNRRARWKTKQLEKDYDTLLASYDSLQADYDNLLKEKDKLKEEVLQLTDKLLMKENEKGNSEFFDMDTLLQEQPQKPVVAEVASEVEESKVSLVACKPEDVSSARSDIFDSDSPHYTDEGVHSSLLEAADSSYHPFEPDQSDLSQDEEDNLSMALLHPPTYVFPKLEDDDYSDPPASSCNFGFPAEDHAFWSWAY